LKKQNQYVNETKAKKKRKKSDFQLGLSKKTNQIVFFGHFIFVNSMTL